MVDSKNLRAYTPISFHAFLRVSSVEYKQGGGSCFFNVVEDRLSFLDLYIRSVVVRKILSACMYVGCCNIKSR